MRILHTPVAACAALLACLVLAGCTAPTSRFGMVVDKKTGLQFGSVVDHVLTMDAGQFRNKKIKVRIRNTSGDPAFDLYRMQEDFESHLANIGYEPTTENDYGLLFNVNVVYSGQASEDLRNQYSFLGALAGGIAGKESESDYGTVGGGVAGLALGRLFGSYLKEETYIVIASVDISIAGLRKIDENSVYFGATRSRVRSTDDGVKAFRKTIGTNAAVYAGGANIDQAEIAPRVRDRLFRILRDII